MSVAARSFWQAKLLSFLPDFEKLSQPELEFVAILPLCHRLKQSCLHMNTTPVMRVATPARDPTIVHFSPALRLDLWSPELAVPVVEGVEGDADEVAWGWVLGEGIEDAVLDEGIEDARLEESGTSEQVSAIKLVLDTYLLL